MTLSLRSSSQVGLLTWEFRFVCYTLSLCERMPCTSIAVLAVSAICDTMLPFAPIYPLTKKNALVGITIP